MQNKSRYLKTIDSFTGRLAERRRLGEDGEAIAQYAYIMVVNRRTNPRLRLDVDEESLPNLLTETEYAHYRRLLAAEWARTQRKVLAAKARADAEAKTKVEVEMQCATKKEKHKEQAEIRKNLLTNGAITIREVARRLNTRVEDVRRLHDTGQLPSSGFVPIQYSRGKYVHLWLPETIIRFLNGQR